MLESETAAVRLLDVQARPWHKKWLTYEVEQAKRNEIAIDNNYNLLGRLVPTKTVRRHARMHVPGVAPSRPYAA